MSLIFFLFFVNILYENQTGDAVGNQNAKKIPYESIMTGPAAVKYVTNDNRYPLVAPPLLKAADRPNLL